MEAKLYRQLYRFVRSLAPGRRGPRQQFSDATIVLVYLWAVLHDRPVSWACQTRHWPPALDHPLPCDTTLSRRLRTVPVLQLIERALAAASDRFPRPIVKAIDSKPLLVGAYSKDRDAKRGRIGAGQFARGYRLHALSHGRTVRCWTLAPMNLHDSVPAPQLIAQLQGGGYTVADNAYDTNTLHALAAKHNHQLIAPPKPAERQVRDHAYNNPHRLRCLDVLASPLEFAGTPGRFGIQLYNQREAIESGFGELTIYGLNYLPAWIRGPRRVALWTAGKLLLHLIRCALRKGLMT
jgi:hypothetical protein